MGRAVLSSSEVFMYNVLKAWVTIRSANSPSFFKAIPFIFFKDILYDIYIACHVGNEYCYFTLVDGELGDNYQIV